MGWKNRLKMALDGQSSAFGRRVEVFLHTLIILSALSMGVETLPNLPQWVKDGLITAEILIVAAFTVEYVLRIVTSPSMFSYARSFFGIIDLIAIAPFYLGFIFLGVGLDLRVIRVVRLFRIFRLLKMVRYTRAISRLTAAWKAVKEEVIVFGIASVLVLYVCALVIYQFENEAQPEAFSSVFDAMWWAAITLTTVGYGDVYPITPIGRLFTVLMLFIALGIIAVPTGLVASALTAIRNKEVSEEAE